MEMDMGNSLSKCKYFKGEKENPYMMMLKEAELENPVQTPPESMRVYYNIPDDEVEKLSNAATCWFYESKWIEFTDNKNDMLDLYLDEYASVGLNSFEHLDGIPITLKALLFNRFAKGYYARIFAVSDFKKWYIENYKGF